MVHVIIEDSIMINGKEVTSNPKMYEFNDEDSAVKFIDRLYDINQGDHSQNLIRARILDYTVKASSDAVPMILHTVHYDHAEPPADGIRYIEDTDVLTVEEIESFRAQGIKPGIVFAYDNPDSIEPSASDELPEYANRFSTVGTDLFADDPDMTFHLSFNPEIGNLLRQKYGHKKEDEIDAL